MKAKNFLEFLNEELQDDVTGKYQSLKKGVLDLVNETVKSTELVDSQNFISNYLENPDSNVLEGFVEESEIFDFYLKYKGDVDEMLTDSEYFDKPPRENDIFSLYDVIIDGTKKSVKKTLNVIKNEMFK